MLQFIRDAWPLITAIAAVISTVTLYFIKLHEWRQTFKESKLKIKELEHKVEKLQSRIISPTDEDIRRYGEALRARGYKVAKVTESASEGTPIFETTLTDFGDSRERQVTGAEIIDRVSNRIAGIAGAYKASGTEFRLYNTRTQKFLAVASL